MYILLACGRRTPDKRAIIVKRMTAAVSLITQNGVQLHVETVSCKAINYLKFYIVLLTFALNILF